MAKEFPEVIELRKIGHTRQNRDINMIVIDARSHLMGDDQSELQEKPAILLTGAHHSRELVSIQMPLYSVLKLLHGGVIHGEKHYVNMLIQNKYYVVPVVNVDGLAYIEHKFVTTGVFSEKRKNMNIADTEMCPDENQGVDLNRNYGVSWDKPGGSSADPCAENYRGPAPFSEPETRAIGRFIM